jgi:hypothetical protein
VATEHKADVPQCLQLSDTREHLIRLEETVRAHVSTCCVACLSQDHLSACYSCTLYCRAPKTRLIYVLGGMVLS